MLHLDALFPSDNDYGIPTIARDGRIPSRLIQWGSHPQLMAVTEKSNTAVHFFLDDYRFESIWNHPVRSLALFKQIGLVLSPDFSLFRDMPVAMQIWNVYRNRWLGVYWQIHGITVIPTITWSDRASYDFCFAGVERGSIVALSSVGVVKEAKARYLFRDGVEKMLEVIQPSAIVCYGNMLDITTTVPVHEFPTRWEEKCAPRRALFPMRGLWEEALAL